MKCKIREFYYSSRGVNGSYHRYAFMGWCLTHHLQIHWDAHLKLCTFV